MSLELLYTSAPSGLKQGSRGFCTVLSTVGMPVNIASRLETLSGYRHVFPPQDPRAEDNPVCFSHVKVAISGQKVSVLSRIAAYGVDYSGRTNKLAHHVVIDVHEKPPAGPAWLLAQSGYMRTDWQGKNETPAARPQPPRADQPPAVCALWESITGDAGWGGHVAASLATNSPKPLWVIFDLAQQNVLLKLINESIALLPDSQRWNATFSTYYTNLPPEIDCRIRCVLAGTEEARLAVARGDVINLTSPSSLPVESSYVQLARTGINPIPVEKERVVFPVAEPALETAPPPAELLSKVSALDFDVPLSHIVGDKPPRVHPKTLPPVRLPDDGNTFGKKTMIAVVLLAGVLLACGVGLIATRSTIPKPIAANAEAPQEPKPDETRESIGESDDELIAAALSRKEKAKTDFDKAMELKPPTIPQYEKPEGINTDVITQLVEKVKSFAESMGTVEREDTWKKQNEEIERLKSEAEKLTLKSQIRRLDDAISMAANYISQAKDYAAESKSFLESRQTAFELCKKELDEVKRMLWKVKADQSTRIEEIDSEIAELRHVAISAAGMLTAQGDAVETDLKTFEDAKSAAIELDVNIEKIGNRIADAKRKIEAEIKRLANEKKINEESKSLSLRIADEDKMIRVYGQRKILIKEAGNADQYSFAGQRNRLTAISRDGETQPVVGVPGLLVGFSTRDGKEAGVEQEVDFTFKPDSSYGNKADFFRNLKKLIDAIELFKITRTEIESWNSRATMAGLQPPEDAEFNSLQADSLAAIKKLQWRALKAMDVDNLSSIEEKWERLKSKSKPEKVSETQSLPDKPPLSLRLAQLARFRESVGNIVSLQNSLQDPVTVAVIEIEFFEKSEDKLVASKGTPMDVPPIEIKMKLVFEKEGD